jgi:hypothetical protein
MEGEKMKITRGQLRRIIKEEIDNGLVREHLEGWVDSHREGGKFSGVGGADYEKSWGEMSLGEKAKVAGWITFHRKKFFSEEAQLHGVSANDSERIWRNDAFQNLLKMLSVNDWLKIAANKKLSAKIEKILYSDSLTDGSVTDRDIDDAVDGVSEILVSSGLINKNLPSKGPGGPRHISGPQANITRARGAPTKKPQIAGTYRTSMGRDLKY